MSDRLKKKFVLSDFQAIMPDSVLKNCLHCGRALCFIERPPYVCSCNSHLCHSCGFGVHQRWGIHNGCAKDEHGVEGKNITLKRISPGSVTPTEILIAKMHKNGQDLIKALEMQRRGKGDVEAVLREHTIKMDKITNSTGIGLCGFHMEAAETLYTRGYDKSPGKVTWNAVQSEVKTAETIGDEGCDKTPPRKIPKTTSGPPRHFPRR